MPPNNSTSSVLPSPSVCCCRYGVGDDVSDWTVTKIAVSGKMKSNESVLFQVGRLALDTFLCAVCCCALRLLCGCLSQLHAAHAQNTSAPQLTPGTALHTICPQLTSPDPSHPQDPLPLSTNKASATITPLVPGGTYRSQLPITSAPGRCEELGLLVVPILVLDGACVPPLCHGTADHVLTLCPPLPRCSALHKSHCVEELELPRAEHDPAGEAAPCQRAGLTHAAVFVAYWLPWQERALLRHGLQVYHHCLLPPSIPCMQVTLLAWMSFVVFVLPRKELATRLGVAVTLFLALAAVQVGCIPCAYKPALILLSQWHPQCESAASWQPVPPTQLTHIMPLCTPPSRLTPQFVVTADQPSSSYILPTQQVRCSTV